MGRISSSSSRRTLLLVAMRGAALSISLASLGIPSPAEGQVGVRIRELEADGVRIDGSIREWRSLHWVSVGQGSDASMRLALGYDARGLYVAAEVRDERLIRTARPTPLEDAVIVTLALPGRRGLRAQEVWLFAGRPGLAGQVAVAAPGARRLSQASGARLVEAPTEGGYSLEAFVPWHRIPGSDRWQEGRIAVRLRDVDREARPEIEAEPATIVVERGALERLPPILPSGGEAAVLERFLRAQGLGATRPEEELRGDVCGDGRPERVVRVGSYVVVFGAGYKGGEGFDFLQLPVQSSADVHEASLRDFTGDRKRELAVRLRQRDARGSRDLFQLFSFDCERVRPLFAIETRKEIGGGHVEVELQVRGRRRPTIEVRVGQAEGLTPERYREARATDAEPILLPWGPTLARSYRWDGERFATVRERANPAPYRPAAQAPARSVSSSPERSGTAARGRPPTVAALLHAVRRERGIARDTRPRFYLQKNVAGGGEPETLVVYGKSLVVVGPAFRGGRSYFHLDLPLPREEDLLSVTTADVTGDGREEVFLRARQMLGDVERELLLVHRFVRGGGFPRVATIEVARSQGQHRLENQVVMGRGRLVVRPGQARGWDEESWPWEEPPPGDVDSLLLPWRDRAVAYQLSQGRLVRR